MKNQDDDCLHAAALNEISKIEYHNFKTKNSLRRITLYFLKSRKSICHGFHIAYLLRSSRIKSTGQIIQDDVCFITSMIFTHSSVLSKSVSLNIRDLLANERKCSHEVRCYHMGMFG
jgi:hypothetical protein